jgi:hypothetical protein
LVENFCSASRVIFHEQSVYKLNKQLVPWLLPTGNQLSNELIHGVVNTST